MSIIKIKSNSYTGKTVSLHWNTVLSTPWDVVYFLRGKTSFRLIQQTPSVWRVQMETAALITQEAPDVMIPELLS